VPLAAAQFAGSFAMKFSGFLRAAGLVCKPLAPCRVFLDAKLACVRSSGPLLKLSLTHLKLDGASRLYMRRHFVVSLFHSFGLVSQPMSLEPAKAIKSAKRCRRRTVPYKPCRNIDPAIVPIPMTNKASDASPV
jgi:hypothetical protein